MTLEEDLFGDTDADSRIGTVLGERYRVEERIGSGGMGVVYKGERIGLNKPVAIKFLHECFASDKRLLARFTREAKATSKLSHPYCVSVIDFGVQESPYIVMDHVDGTNLDEILKEKRFSVSDSLRFTSQILAGVAHAHSNGIIHRDIKPANVMICEAEGVGHHACIFDFGLAKLLDAADAAQTLSAVVLGTPNYMSPEQSLGEEVDPRADVYSIGVLLFELLTGQRPFIEQSAGDVLKKHREDPVPTLTEIDGETGFSDELEEVIKNALAKSRDDRYQSAAEFLDALKATPEGVTNLADVRRGGADSDADDTGGSGLRRADSTDPTILMDENRLGNRILRFLALPFQANWGKGPRLWSVVGVLCAIVTIAVIAWVTMEPRDARDEPTIDTGAAAESLELSSVHSPPKLDLGDAGDTPNPAEKLAVSNGLADARAKVAEGRWEEAIDDLKVLRRTYPKDPSIPHYMGNLFFEQKWWKDALERYNLAITVDDSYRSNSEMIKNVIEMLGTKKPPQKARSFLNNKVALPAVPHLEEASIHHENPKTRRRAAEIAKAIQEK